MGDLLGHDGDPRCLADVRLYQTAEVFGTGSNFGNHLEHQHARSISRKDDMHELIERWHKFAGQSKEEIAAQFNDETRALFAEFFTKSFHDTGPQGARWASADEFAQYVLELRANERAWSRYLGDTILRAHDLMEEGRLDEAKQELRTFQDICPWIFFAGVAETQLQSLPD